MAEVPRPYPLPDRDTAPFWEAQNQHHLTFQRCSGCGFVRYPVCPLCPECRSFAFEWIMSTGRGVVHSFTVVQHQTHPAFPVPYIVVLAQMEEGPRIVAQFRGAADARPEIGMAVRIQWEDHPKQSLPVFVAER